MKVQKTYEALLKDSTTAAKYLDELQRNNFQGRIEDWDSFINLLHDKKLKAESEVVLVNYLSANILENQYQHSLSSTQDSKIILNLLNIISFKIKSQTEEQKRLLSIPYGTIYCYLSRKIYKNLQDFNDSHKKIKQRIEEDGKHLTKLVEFCLVDVIGNQSTASSNNLQLIEMIKPFFYQFHKLQKKQPHIFKNQAKLIEHILFQALERKSESQQELVLLPEEIHDEVVLLFSCLPLSVNTAAAYPDRVKYFINRFINNFYYGFLFACRGIANEDILRNYTYEDTFAAQPNFIFDWESLKATTSNSSNEAKNALLIRLKLLTKLIIQTIASVKPDSAHTWNMLNYLKIVENVISLDAKYLEKKVATKKGARENISHLESSLLEDKIVLIKEDYEQFSLTTKCYALDLLNAFIETSEQGFTKYTEWLYNALYFITINYETRYSIVKHLLKTCVTILKSCGSLFFEFGEYLLFQSPLNPLELLQQYYGNYLKKYKLAANTETSAAVDEMNFRKDKKGKKVVNSVLSLSEDPKGQDRIVIRETGIILTKQNLENELILSMNMSQFSTITNYILETITLFLSKCGRLQVKPELIASLDSAFSKIISYPRVFAFSPSENKIAFLECLESILLNNILKYEESQLIGEFDLFYSQYVLAEKEQDYVSACQQVKNRIFCIRQSKRLSFIDNSIDLQNYFEKRHQQFFNDRNNETQAEDSILQSEYELSNKNATTSQIKTNTTSKFNTYELKKTFTEELYPQRSLDETESWGGEQTEGKEQNLNGQQQINTNGNSNLNLKRTFTDLLSDSSSKDKTNIPSDEIQKKQQVDSNKDLIMRQQSLMSNKAVFNSENESEGQRMSQIPTEANKVPIVFGKATENKNILFAKPATSNGSVNLFGETKEVEKQQMEEEKKGEEVDVDDNDEILLNPVLDSD